MILNNTIYQQKVNDLRNSVYNIDKTAFYKSPFILAYMDMSTSLSTFLPNVNKANHFKLSQDMLFHKNLSFIDQFNPHVHEELMVIDKQSVIANSKEKGHIYVTYHTGSYRLIMFHLISKKIPLSIVAQREFIESNGKELQEIVNKTNSNPVTLDFIPAEDARLLFKLKSKMSEGNSVLFYIDGNTGVSEKDMSENDNMSKIDFLGHQIYARQGIAFLAYLTKAPVVTAICKRDEELNNKLVFSYLDSDQTDESQSRQDYINDLTKRMYHELSEFVEKYPEQWEGWFYMNKFYDSQPRETISVNQQITNSLKNETVTVGVDDFAELYHTDTNFYVALKKDFKIKEIDSDKYEIAQHFEEKRQLVPYSSFKIADQELPWNFVEELISQNILRIS